MGTMYANLIPAETQTALETTTIQITQQNDATDE